MKKLMSLVLTLALLCSVSATVFAAAVPSSTGAAGHLLDYAVETVIVPTALKMTLNPNGYPVTTKYEKATAYDANTTYYTDATGATEATVADETAFGNGTFYKAKTSTAQVVSFNYGIVSKATAEKKVTVSLAAAYTANTSGTEKITFVDSLAEAQAYNETSNPNGAKRGELKIYLEAAASTALPTAETYAKTTGDFDASKTYYTKSGSDYSKATITEFAADTTYYEATTAIGVEITAAELADVTMTADTTGAVAFAAGTTNKADAKIAFKLGGATYAVKDGSVVTFDTTMDDLSGLLEMTAPGGVAAFTLTGAINKDADWTKSEAKAITITPTYKVDDATGDETASGGYNQITAAPAATPPSIATTSYTANGTDPVVISVNLGSGNLAATGIANANAFGADYLGQTVIWDATAKTVTVDAGAAAYCAAQNEKVVIVFDDTAGTSVDITFTA